MRRKAWNVLAAVAICGLMNAATADAIEGFSPVVYEESSYVNNEIASLRAEIDSLNLRMVSSVTSGYGDESKGGYGKSCCRGAGFSAGAELAFLKPHNGDGMGIVSVFALAGTANVGAVDTDFDAAPRVWLAYQSCDGLGVRVRYWQFDQIYTAPASGTTVFGAVTGNAFHGFDTWVLDAEVIDSSKLGRNWDATYSGGLRYLQYTEVAGLAGTLNFVGSKHIDAIGLTTSLEVRRDVTSTWGIFGIARASVLYGDENSLFVGAVTVATTQLNNVKAIYETQLGVEYVRPFRYGSYFVRAGVEAQFWNEFGLDNQPLTSTNFVDPQSFDTSVGFAGGFFALGFNW